MKLFPPIVTGTVVCLIGVTFRPEFISQLPEGLKMIFSSGISTGTIVALILNKVLTEEKEEIEESEEIREIEKVEGLENEKIAV